MKALPGPSQSPRSSGGGSARPAPRGPGPMGALGGLAFPGVLLAFFLVCAAVMGELAFAAQVLAVLFALAVALAAVIWVRERRRQPVPEAAPELTEEAQVWIAEVGEPTSSRPRAVVTVEVVEEEPEPTAPAPLAIAPGATVLANVVPDVVVVREAR